MPMSRECSGMAQALALLLLGLGRWGWASWGQPAGRYLSGGDGSALEFDFPERSRGVMVVSSRYLGTNGTASGAWLSAASLAPAVLTVENVSALCCGAGGFLVAIRSGPAGLAPLRLRLLDQHQLVEERGEFRVRVMASEEPGHPGLGHFSENPLLYALLPLIFVNKCAFGCKVELEALRELARQPQPVLLGIVGQFIAMPLYGYLLSLAFALPPALALGLVVTCSSPGGGGGYLYSLLLGGFALILGGLLLAYHMGAVILAEVEPPVVLAGLTVPLVGLGLGYLLAACLRLPGPHCRTVSIEVGVQNSLLALAVLQLSFRRRQADYASQAPFVVALSSTAEMLVLVLAHLLYKKLQPSASP
nr:P3 protein [Pelodiscus sinensis]|eukprot:XP_025037257.1 P3 protein [Pelodiscus sinensis]